jgi:uncharacterized protein YceK
MKDIPNNIFWLVLAILAVITLLGGCSILSRSVSAKEERMIKAGYIQKQLPDRFTSEWVKEEPTK